jgi:hypothetical protein
MVVLGLVESAKAYYPEDWCFAAEVMSELINSTGTWEGINADEIYIGGITENKMYIYGGYINDLPRDQRASTKYKFPSEFKARMLITTLQTLILS